MKLVKIAGLCLASVLAVGMALAGTAAAIPTPLWLLCLPWTNNPTRYTTNQCKTAEAGSGGWESVSIGNKSDTVRILVLSLRLEDEKGELGSSVRAKCDHVTGYGLISNRNLLLVFKAEVEHPEKECEAEGTGLFKACKTSTLTEVRGTDLPWRTEVYEETEGKFISNILEHGKSGEPGWKVTCANVSDTCTSEAGKPVKVSGVNALTEEETEHTRVSTLLVFAQFLPNKGSCSVGGKEAGNVAGWLAILLYNGNGLSLNLF